jgi:hypothetical protein
LQYRAHSSSELPTPTAATTWPQSRTAGGDDIRSYLCDHYEIKNFLAEWRANRFVARAVLPCYAMSRRASPAAGDPAVAAKRHAEVARAIAMLMTVTTS